jgi:hypothetical protein
VASFANNLEVGIIEEFIEATEQGFETILEGYNCSKLRNDTRRFYTFLHRLPYIFG